MTTVLIPAYAPPISYMACLLKQEKITWVQGTAYKKQTYRNRAYIYGANGRLTLTIPIVHTGQEQRQKDHQVRTHLDSRWQQLHWKSLEAAYRSSPFFEYYEDTLHPVYEKKNRNLFDFNKELITTILGLMDVSIPQTASPLNPLHHKINESLMDAKKKTIVLPSYRQVFGHKFGFISNLSILDLLFNLGPESLSYLKICQHRLNSS